MSLLVTGSIGIDTVRSPFGESVDCLGGSVTYFSMAASFFTRVRFMGVVGEDCPVRSARTVRRAGCRSGGAGSPQGQQDFSLGPGTYQANMNIRNTDSVELNVLAEAPPVMPEKL